MADRFRSLDSRVFDGLIAIGLAILGAGSQLSEPTGTSVLLEDTDAVAVVLGLFATLPVYWRRRQPLPALVVSAAAVTTVGVLEYRTENLPVAAFFLVYAVGAYATQRDALIGLAVAGVAILTIYLSDTPDLNGEGTVLNLVLFAGGWLAGQVVRSRNDLAAARLAEAEERAQTELEVSARAVAEERLRLAQELHDVVAHSMSVIAVQAGMGAHVLDAQPDEARRALDAISDTSRSTLHEMRRLLGVLRDEDGTRSHSPAPDLADLARLVDDVRAAGVPVELTVDGPVGDVPHAVQLSVYRMVQEGLTNVLKHAGPASATVSVRCSPEAVDVDISDDGRGAAVVGGDRGGHGLVGMRERVAIWGGSLETGPRPGGGFHVTAHLPFGEGP